MRNVWSSVEPELIRPQTSAKNEMTYIALLVVVHVDDDVACHCSSSLVYDPLCPPTAGPKDVSCLATTMES